MKFLRIFLISLFVVIFVLSISFNVILGLSSTNSLIFKDSKEARMNLYTKASYTLDNVKSLTIVNDSPYNVGNITGFSKDTITCSIEGEETNCAMISTLHDTEGTLLRTSYFPGDGYKYTINGTTKIKTAYPNASLSTTFSGFFLGAKISMMYMVGDSSSSSAEFSFKTKTKFSFNTFSLVKTVNASCKNGEKIYDYSFTFDGKDRLEKVYSKEQDSTLSFEYKKVTLSFPSFDQYTGV